jgi:hypothetical protein
LDDLIGGEVTGEEQERLQDVHDLLLQAGPPPELPPKLAAGPTLAMTAGPRGRLRPTKPRALMLLAAALVLSLVFFAGYVVANNGSGSTTVSPPKILKLAGTSIAPQAQAQLAVWRPRDGNWPMKLTAIGLPKLPPRTYYEVFLVRHGKPWGSCGTFRVLSSGPVTVALTAPYSLQKGDSWVVTRQGVGGVEPGKTVLRPVTT